MRGRSTVFAVIAAMGLAALTLAAVRPASSAEAKPAAAKDVMLIRCATDASTFTVGAYQGSANTPAKRAESCPEVLAHLLREGFEIGHVGHSRVDTNFVVYTLLR